MTMTSDTRLELLTIGHSSHPLEVFLALLVEHRVTAVADVRSTPYSRRHPQYDKEQLSAALREHHIGYVFLGAELGARSKDAACYVDGRVQYARLAATEQFKRGLTRLIEGARSYRIAIMCAEREPLECHRTLLVTRALEREGAQVSHICSDGSLEPNHAAMLRLLEKLGLPREDLFRAEPALIEEAVRQQEARIAYVVAPPARISQRRPDRSK
jgi:uncharacterized protein (DUF488 family)